MDKKDKINFDLDFLEKNTKEKPKELPKSKDPNWVYHKDNSGTKGSPKPPVASSSRMSDTAKKWAWGIGIVVAIVIFSSLGGNSSTPTNSMTTEADTNSNRQVQVGNYMCSSYAASQADSMAPSSVTEASLTAEENQVNAMSNARKAEKQRLDSVYVDQTDQTAIDSYNAQVDAYNASYQPYSDAYDAWEVKKSAYNATVDAYNNYLKQNCTPN